VDQRPFGILKGLSVGAGDLGGDRGVAWPGLLVLRRRGRSGAVEEQVVGVRELHDRDPAAAEEAPDELAVAPLQVLGMKS
jgi:hypothetical protein